MKKSIHVHEVITIDKDVAYCGDCPYYYEDRDMGCTHSCCEKMGTGYDSFIPDICWRDCNKKISNYCPFLKKGD